MPLGWTQLTLEEWERTVYSKAATLDGAHPMKDYVEHIRYRDYFGAMLFAVKQKFEPNIAVIPKVIFLGISRQGILFLKVPTSYTAHTMTTFKRFPLGDIYRWAFKPGMNFHFEVKAADGGDTPDEYLVKTTEGESMSDLLTDYAMALLREMGLNPDGTPRAKPAAASASSTAASSSAAETPSGGLAKSVDAYSGVKGDAGVLAQAATRSGAVAADEDEEEEEEAPVEEEAVPEAAGDDVEQLPEGWSKQFDEDSGSHYYFNEVTGESSWDPPQM
jgi:hypothetical protein